MGTFYFVQIFPDGSGSIKKVRAKGGSKAYVRLKRESPSAQVIQVGKPFKKPAKTWPECVLSFDLIKEE